ncbi:hypothetical protein INR49_016927 [Caranx melampygus]|nr:hypothetical protein INR49_016927 [Caranx melampygus]
MMNKCATSMETSLWSADKRTGTELFLMDHWTFCLSYSDLVTLPRTKGKRRKNLPRLASCVNPPSVSLLSLLPQLPHIH